MAKLSYLTSIIIFAFSWSPTNGLLKGPSTVKSNNKTRQRKLMMEKKDAFCDNDASVKVLGSNDCNIELSSANGDDDSLIILEDDMECNFEFPSDDDAPSQTAISISSSRTTLDCRGHKIINRGETGNGIKIEQGNNIIVRNCDISLLQGYQSGVLPECCFTESSVTRQHT